jgi:hypothetical protein
VTEEWGFSNWSVRRWYKQKYSDRRWPTNAWVYNGNAVFLGEMYAGWRDIENKTIKYGYKSCRTQPRERLHWRVPATAEK